MGLRNKHKVVGIGEILWDMMPQGKQLGGAPANFIYHVQNLGGEDYLVSKVGTDKLGDEILNRVKQLGLNHSYILRDKYHPTGTVSVNVDEEGNPDYVVHQQVAWDYLVLEQKFIQLARRADAVCFGTLALRNHTSRNSIHRFLDETKKECLRVYDINLRAPYYNKGIIHSLLEKSNILKLNREELKVISRIFSISGSEEKILNYLLERYSFSLIALTLGKEGSRLLSLERESFHPGFKVKVKDSVGAGDSFTAALVMGILSGDKLDKVNALSNKLASFVCSKNGAWTKIPDSLRF